MTYVPELHWGDGSDGNVTISVDTDLNGTVKQYNNLIINAGVKLYDSTGFLKIFVRNKLTVNGTIDQSGYGSAGGAKSTAATYKCNDVYNGDSPDGGSPIAIINAAGGGSGGAACSPVGNYKLAPGGSGGAVGVPTTGTVPASEILNYMGLFDSRNATHPGVLTVKAGAGGGGGAAGAAALRNISDPDMIDDAGSHGGDGGAGGGFAVIIAKAITGTGSIISKGLAGSAGVNNPGYSAFNFGGGAGGGGGGGSGGYISVITKANFSVTTDVTGGDGGAAAWADALNDASPDAWSSPGATGSSGVVNVQYWR